MKNNREIQARDERRNSVFVRTVLRGLNYGGVRAGKSRLLVGHAVRRGES